MRNATILIVEDDGILAINLRRMISLMGYTVAGPLATGEEAIDFLARNKVDLVLMDIELAGPMNGITAVEIINRTFDLPVVFLTGFSQDPMLEQAKIAAPYGYLIKPVPERELAATLDMALHRHKLDHELKESKRALEISEAKYRHLFANSPLGIIRSSLGGKVLAVNAEMARIYGCDTPEEALRDFTNLAEQFYCDPARREKLLSRLRENGSVHHFEYEGRKKNGERVWVSTNAKLTPAEESQGQTGEMVIDGFVIDITERRKAEEQIANDRYLKQLLLDHFPGVVLLLRTWTREVVASNQAGVNVGAVCGSICFKTWGQSQAPCPWCLAPALWETGKEQRVEIEAGEKVFEAHWVPVTDDLYMHYSFDITERKRVEEENKSLQERLIQAHKMEAIGTLAGGIAHDFNNILGAILGYAEIARDTIPAGSDLAHDLDRVLEAGARAANLVKQILAFSRQQNIERVPLKPGRVVKETLKFLRASLPATITIKQHIDTGTRSILADPTQIHQIVMNLCTNAFHAMEQTGGTIEISIEDCEFSEKDLRHWPEVQPGRFVSLSVSDTGPGICPEIWGKIFDPYFTTKEVGKGTGLGLAIIHGIVTDYGGFIKHEGRPGNGTIFHVYFPAVNQEIVSAAAPVEKAPRGTDRILLIDDDKVLAEMGKTMLERMGYEVTVRTSSLEALATFQRHPNRFDAVITDQTMPGLTGMDLARQMLLMHPGIPIILCTGYSTLVNEEHAKAAGIKGFIMKPMSKKDIAQCLRTVLDA